MGVYFESFVGQMGMVTSETLGHIDMPAYVNIRLRTPSNGRNTTTHPGHECVHPQEFAAHSGNVQCVALGRRSFKVLATGGDDRKVTS